MEHKTTFLEPSPGKQKVRLAVVTNFTLLSESLCQLVSQEEDWLILAGIGRKASDCIELVRKVSPDVLLLYPHGLEKDAMDIIKQIQSIDSATRLLLLTQNISDHWTLRLLTAGASGFVPHDAKPTDLLKAIREVSQGGVAITGEIQRLCAEKFLTPQNPKDSAHRLSDREFQVLRMIANGLTNREIAARLSVSVKTIDTHRGNLLKKLSLRNNSDLTRYAISQGLVET